MTGEMDEVRKVLERWRRPDYVKTMSLPKLGKHVTEQELEMVMTALDHMAQEIEAYMPHPRCP